MPSPDRRISDTAAITNTKGNSDPLDRLLERLVAGDATAWREELCTAQKADLLRDPVAQERVVFAVVALFHRCRDVTSLGQAFDVIIPLFTTELATNTLLHETIEACLTKLKDIDPLAACEKLLMTSELPWRPDPRGTHAILQAARYRASSPPELRAVVAWGAALLRAGYLSTNRSADQLRLSDQELEPLGFFIASVFKPTPVSHGVNKRYREEPSLCTIAERMCDGSPLLAALLSSGLRLKSDRTFKIVNNAIRGLSTVGVLLALECRRAAGELTGVALEEAQKRFWSLGSIPRLGIPVSWDQNDLREVGDALLKNALHATFLCFEEQETEGGWATMRLKAFLHATTVQNLMAVLKESRISLKQNEINMLAEVLYRSLRTEQVAEILCPSSQPHVY